MRLYIALIIAMIFLDECVSHSNSGVSYNNSEVIGCWKQSGTNLSYTYLIFKRDSTAIFESKADTIYRFKYWVTKNELILEDVNRIYKCPILELTIKKFTFEDVVVNKKKLFYQRDSCISSN